MNSANALISNFDYCSWSPTAWHFNQIRSSTVAIVTRNGSFTRLVGTGFLFRIADLHLLITAHHVLTEAENKDITIVGHKSQSAQLEGKCKFSKRSLDTASVRLSSTNVENLEGVTFLNFASCTTARLQSQGICSLIGCPQTLSKSAHFPNSVKIGEIQIISRLFDGKTSDLNGFDENFHLLVEADQSRMECNGGPFVFETPEGHRLSFPGDLKGISGCPIFDYGGSSSRKNPKLLGVQTGIYQSQRLIKASRFECVRQFLVQAYPEIKQASSIMEL